MRRRSGHAPTAFRTLDAASILWPMFEPLAAQTVQLVLYTDAFVVRGQVRTRQRRLSDLLNQTDKGFIVLEEASFDEFGSRDSVHRTDYAQVNLAAVLFAVADQPVEALPELRTPKIQERALITIPPFRIVGRIHLMPERDLHDALDELSGRFLPVTEATYWSDKVGEPRQTAPMVAFNHARAQILAPYQEVDPWEGLSHDQAAQAGS